MSSFIYASFLIPFSNGSIAIPLQRCVQFSPLLNMILLKFTLNISNSLPLLAMLSLLGYLVWREGERDKTYEHLNSSYVLKVYI